MLLGGADVSDHRRAAVDADAEARPVRPPGRHGLGSIGKRKRGSRRAQRMVGLVDGCVEDDHHGVAREPLDHPVLGRDDGHDLRPVGVQHGDDLGRGRPLGEGGEALEVCEEDADVPFLASELRRAGVAQARSELRREVGAEELVEPAQLAGRPLEERRFLVAEPTAARESRRCAVSAILAGVERSTSSLSAPA